MSELDGIWARNRAFRIARVRQRRGGACYEVGSDMVTATKMGVPEPVCRQCGDLLRDDEGRWCTPCLEEAKSKPKVCTPCQVGDHGICEQSRTEGEVRCTCRCRRRED